MMPWLRLSALWCCAVLACMQQPAVAQAPAAEAAEEKPAAALKIPLVRHLRMVLRPTILGLVPPDDPLHLGEVFVRVTEIVPGFKLDARYEIKEQGVWEAPGAEDEDARPGRQRPAVRFRRGSFAAQAQPGSGPAIIPPLLWTDGNFDNGGGVLWLPRRLYEGLTATGSVDWDPAFGDAGLAAELELLYGVDALAGVRLELLERSVNYPVDVNGQRSWLKAFSATDSLGAATYIILDDVDNPLVLKLSFAGDPAARGLDDEADAAGAGSADPAEAGSNLVASGAGYAVVSLDF